METAVREEGAVPATVGLFEGRVVVGLTGSELERFAAGEEVPKASTRDLAPAAAAGWTAGTTVSATARLAAAVGIRILSTGGIGGVHRGGEESLDISADLTELARSPVAVVCSGAKAVLDLSRTLEMLETLGVPVVGHGTDELPAFFARESGLPLAHRVDNAEEAAAVIRAHGSLGPVGGILFAVPPPAEVALDRLELEAWIERALADARREGVSGQAVTPYLLGRIAHLSAGRSVEANLALLERNARIAARIAVALTGRSGSPGEARG